MFNYFSSSGNYAFETQLKREKQRKLRRMMRPLISPSYMMLEIKAKSLRHFREDNSKKIFNWKKFNHENFHYFGKVQKLSLNLRENSSLIIEKNAKEITRKHIKKQG